MREPLEKQQMTRLKALLSTFRPHWFKEEEELDKIAHSPIFFNTAGLNFIF